MVFLESALTDLNVKKSKSKWLKWFWWLLAASVALTLIGVVTYQLIGKSKKAAEALHKVDVLTEEKNLEKVKAQLANSDAEYAKHIKKVEAAEVKIKKYKDRAAKLTTEHEEATALINRIQRWSDVDETIK